MGTLSSCARRPRLLGGVHRRGLDRAGARLTALVLAALLVVPWIAWWSTQRMYRDGMRAEAWERQPALPVVVVLVEGPSGDRTGRSCVGPAGAMPSGPGVTASRDRVTGCLLTWVD
jgi:hypothetical protein